MLPIIEPVIGLITQIVGRIWPDKTEHDKAVLAAALQEDNNLTQLLTAQINVNQEEAKSSNVFVAGWRPAIGWICGLAFAWEFVVMPILAFISAAFGHTIPVPVFDGSTMITVLMGMLGLGGLRTFEKIKGVS